MMNLIKFILMYIRIFIKKYFLLFVFSSLIIFSYSLIFKESNNLVKVLIEETDKAIEKPKKTFLKKVENSA